MERNVSRYNPKSSLVEIDKVCIFGKDDIKNSVLLNGWFHATDGPTDVTGSRGRGQSFDPRRNTNRRDVSWISLNNYWNIYNYQVIHVSYLISDHAILKKVQVV